MEGCNQQRAKINFKIPMKTNQSSPSKSDAYNIETFSSPIMSVSDDETSHRRTSVQNTNKIRREPSINDASSNETSLKRKAGGYNSRMFDGRKPEYPEELNNLILPLYCTLCTATLNSSKSAHFHYLSKSHEKKVMRWLEEWAQKTGEPVPKIVKTEVEVPKDSNVLFCEYCKIKLTSTQDAKQHYSGKKHAIKVRNGGVNFLGDTPKNVSISNKDGRFGIGTGFKPTEETEELTPKEETIDNLTCDICNIKTTSEPQLQLHFAGVKHLKKYKELHPDEAFAERDAKLPKSILMCRTPSGQFYCKICDITVADDQIFAQHLSSKRHAKNSKKEA